MDQEIKNKIEEQGAKIDEIYRSVEKTRKYFLIVIWITIIALVLPFLGLGLVMPSFLGTYNTVLESGF